MDADQPATLPHLRHLHHLPHLAQPDTPGPRGAPQTHRTWCHRTLKPPTVRCVMAKDQGTLSLEQSFGDIQWNFTKQGKEEEEDETFCICHSQAAPQTRP